jgi:hypothetical protein
MENVWRTEIKGSQKEKALYFQGPFLFKLVEAAGIEPASGNLPTEHLHT